MALKILSILGIILLCLLALIAVALLLLLFWPVAYRGGGSARAGEYRAWFGFRWLFGLVRGAYSYPEGGRLKVKVLWMTVYDSGGKQKKTSPGDKSSGQEAESGQKAHTGKIPEKKGWAQSGRPDAEEEGQAQPKQAADKGEEQAQPKQAADKGEEQARPKQAADKGEGQAQPKQAADEEEGYPPAAGGEALPDKAREVPLEASAGNGEQGRGASEGGAADQKQPLSEKLTGLKEKLQFYLELVRNEDNQELVKHGLKRLHRIIKSARPRFLRAEALAGLGEPDLTGYAYGAYWAVRPFLGKKCHVTVTPDFERRVLEGEVTLGGRIMAAVILHHVAGVLLDRRLRQLLEKLKKQK